MRHRLLTIALIIVAGMGFAASQLVRLSTDTSLSSWYNNAAGYQTALTVQKQSVKPLAVFFQTDGCSSCKQLKANVLGKDYIANYMRNFIPVTINPEYGSAERLLAQQYGVYGYPSFFIQKPDSVSPVRIPVTGHTNPQQFMRMCDKALQS